MAAMEANPSPSKSGTPEEVLPELIVSLRLPLRRILARYRIPHQDGGDLLQATFLILLSKWEQVESPGAWLVGVLRKRCIIYWRRRRSENERYVPLEDGRDFPVDGEQGRRALAVDLKRLAVGLSARDRRMVVMQYRLGMVDAEVAKATGLRPRSIRKTMNRALHQMRWQANALASWRKVSGPSTSGADAWMGSATAKALGRREDRCPLTWPIAVRAYLSTARYARSTCREYEAHLLRAEGILEFSGFGHLVRDALAAYRAAVVMGPPQAARQALCALRGFLEWGGELGLHELPESVIREVLRPPGGAQRATRRGRPQHWRRGN